MTNFTHFLSIPSFINILCSLWNPVGVSIEQVTLEDEDITRSWDII